jgi:alginate O-acetyltransferase complex protein AlgI
VLFNSYAFLLFFLCVFSFYQLLHDPTTRKCLLLVSSYVFYAAWYAPYVGILLLSTTVDWWMARLISRSDDPGRRKALLLISLVCNLALLGFFKYGGFILDNASELLSIAGIAHRSSEWSIVLPIGISFYTFASLSYTIDVYRREVAGDAGWLDYALFVSFFPHLVAGPIVRAKVLLPQIAEPRSATERQMVWGAVLFCIGLFAKVVLADSIFAPVVEQVYANPTNVVSAEAWAAVLGFSGQIYFDFSGYSLCAIGIALCFGFEFPDNFRYPYGARSFSDFWRRWHITLSTWLRDYLYIPLGGSFHGEEKTYRNLMLTMLLGGLWHGASWMFVLWGGLHGVYLCAERSLRTYRQPALPTGERSAAVATLLVFLIVTLTWIPFRASGPASAAEVAMALARFGTPHTLNLAPMMVAYATIVVTIAWQLYQRDRSLEEWFAGLGRIAQVAVVGGCVISMFLCSGGDERAFIYFQF